MKLNSTSQVIRHRSQRFLSEHNHVWLALDVRGERIAKAFESTSS